MKFYRVSRRTLVTSAIVLAVIPILFGPITWLRIQIFILRSDPNAGIDEFIARLGRPHFVEHHVGFASDKRHPINQWFQEYPLEDGTTYYLWSFETLPYFWFLVLEDSHTSEIIYSSIRMPP